MSTFTSTLAAKLLVSKAPISRSSSFDSIASTFSTFSMSSSVSSVDTTASVDLSTDSNEQPIFSGGLTPFRQRFDMEDAIRWQSFFTYYYRVHLLCQIVCDIAYEKVNYPDLALADADHIAILCIIAIFEAVFLLRCPRGLPSPYMESAHKFDWIKADEDDAVGIDATSTKGSPETANTVSHPTSILETPLSYTSRPVISRRVTFPPDPTTRTLRRSRRSLILPRVVLEENERLPGAGWKPYDSEGKRYTFTHLANWVPPREDPRVAFSWYDNCSEAALSQLEADRERERQEEETKAQETAKKDELLWAIFTPASTLQMVATRYPLSIPAAPRPAFELARPELDDIMEVDEKEEKREVVAAKVPWNVALKIRLKDVGRPLAVQRQARRLLGERR